jgi:AcrR family transcriptional regulator
LRGIVACGGHEVNRRTGRNLNEVPRKYELNRRADTQAATRRRIVTAAIELHQAIGPAKTTVTEIAERAGVGRPTVYRHFPDEQALLLACSGQYWQDHPAPDPQAWRDIANPYERLRTALREAYAYHRRTEEMISRALADVGDKPVMQPYHDHWRRAAEVVASAWDASGTERRLLRAAVRHALDFTTWRSLVREQRLNDAEAIDLIARLVQACAADRLPHHGPTSRATRPHLEGDVGIPGDGTT